MKKDVFISYSSRDRDWAEQVRKVLSLNQISCWIAPDCIPGGSNYTTEIPLAIKSCAVFMILLTDDSVDSPWVKKELDTAINEKKLILPLLLAETTLSADFSFLLNGVQYYSTDSKEDFTSAVLDRIKETRSENSVSTKDKNNSEPKHFCPKCGFENLNDDYNYVELTAYQQIRGMLKDIWLYAMPSLSALCIFIVLWIKGLSPGDYKVICMCGLLFSIQAVVIKGITIYYPLYKKQNYLKKGFLVHRVSCCRCGHRFKLKISAENNIYKQ